MKIRLVVAKLFHVGGWMDRWTDMTKLIATFGNCVNVPKNHKKEP